MSRFLTPPAHKLFLIAIWLSATPWMMAAPAFAQEADQDLEMRVEQLEAKLRQLTGQNEELQYRNRQLEEQLRAMQSGQAAGPGAPQRGTAMTAAQPNTPAPEATYQTQPSYSQQPGYPQQGSSQTPNGYPQPPSSQASGRRGDAFDPAANPNAPGAPRPLGSIVGQPSAPLVPNVGAPGGRDAGEPLDLANTNGQPAGAPPPTGREALGQVVATLPPTNSPRDEFDLGYGYIERKDYALADQTLRAFLQKYPSDRLAGDANYWLGESLFQRQRYRDAAESFLTVTTKYESSAKVPDALLRLGQSLAALKEKEAACAAFGEVARKYPRASAAVKQSVEREQKRIRC